MKTGLFFCALFFVVVTPALAAEGDSNYQKAAKVRAVEKADKVNVDVEGAAKYHAGKNASKEEVQKAARGKALKEARDLSVAKDSVGSIDSQFGSDAENRRVMFKPVP